MKNLSPEERLCEEAMRLRSHAPQVWDDFLVALDAYAVLAAEQLVQSAQPSLQQNQGKAQAIRSLHRTLRDAPEVALELRKNRNAPS